MATEKRMKSKRRRVVYAGLIAGLAAGGINLQTLASESNQYQMNLNISGAITANGNCNFVQSYDDDIRFGEVKFKTIDGQNTLEGDYQQTLSSDMNCSDDIDENTQMILKPQSGVAMTWQGGKLLAVQNAAGEAMPSLGIQLLVNGHRQDIDTWFDVDMDAQPSIIAKLVQTGDGAEFRSGETFSASATLTMAFN